VQHVVAEEAERQHPPPVRTVDTAGGVERQHVEEDGVARLELPADHPEAIRLAVDIREIGEGAFREPLRLAVEERPRHVPGAEVRASHELERRRPADRVDWEPHADVLAAFDVVVRQILVPRRSLTRARLLDEDVVVVEPHLA